MTIRIEIAGNSAVEILEDLRRLAVGMAVETVPAAPVAEQPKALKPADEPETPATVETPATPARERGKPSAGRARRTKEEIAEDEALDAADAAVETKPETAAISTGEERINPEEAAQDEADEAADEANAPAATATRDDVRAAMTAYNEKHGMARLTADMAAILKARWPDGKVTKLSEIPDDAEAFAAVIADLNAAGA